MNRRGGLLLALLLLLTGSTLSSAAEIAVFAASSLSAPLREIAGAYHRQHPTTHIALNFAGSQTLATQIEQGAPADLFMSADWQAMERLQEKGLVTPAQTLLHNRLVLAVRPEIRPAVTTMADLARPGLLLTVGNRQVPIGRYTRQLFANLAADPGYGPALLAKIEKNIVSEENRAKAIVAKLLLDETDAGILYQSDLSAANAERLTAVALPQQHNPRASYPLAKVSGATPDTDSFWAFLCAPGAREIFVRHGFSWGYKQ